jgi:hypothetical protein
MQFSLREHFQESILPEKTPSAIRESPGLSKIDETGFLGDI